MIDKQRILDVLEKMPQDISLDDLLDKLLFMQKVEQGRTQSKSGNIISDHDLDNHLPEWLK